MGPDKDFTRPAGQNHRSAARSRGRARSAPRARHCLLKGCEQRFHPERATQRYCSEPCRRAARRWSRWKAQQSYRATGPGREKRNGQSRRYRQRVRERRPAAPAEAAAELARVISKDFFRSQLRPTGLL
jgi:hypothetical protein